MDDDKSFEANEIRFWSVKTQFRFILLGLPRLIIILLFFIILFIVYLIFGKNNNNYNFLTKYASKILLILCGYKNFNIDTESLNNIKNSKAQIIVSSHASYMDAIVLMSLFPNAKFITSHFVKNMPIINNIFEKKAIYLKDNFRGKLTDLITEELKKGEKIIFFSAGVCHNPEYVLKLRNGAFVPRLNILPIHISYNDNEYFVNGEQDMYYHLFNHITQRRNKFTLRALKDYEISNEEKNGDIEVFKDNFINYYAKGFNLKISSNSYKDHPYFKINEKNFPEKN